MASLFGFKRISAVNRSSRLELFCKKGFLKKFAKFTGKHLYGSLFFNKNAACKARKFIKKENVFSCKFHKIFKNIFFTEPLRTATSVPTGSFLFRRKIIHFFFTKAETCFY